MPRRSLAWLSALPLMVAGSLVAHSLAYRIVEPDAEHRADVLATTGHGYLAYFPAMLAACLTLLLAGLAGHLVPLPPRTSARSLDLAGRARPAPRLRASGAPLERMFAWGHLPLAAALEPTFLVGLALQVPFALAALLLARALVGVAERVGRTLATVSPGPAPRALAVPIGVEALLPRVSTLALGRAGRAPPA